MEQITFNTYKISYRLQLTTIASFFNLRNPISWKDYLKIEGDKLEAVLKYSSTDKKVYFFKFGCITFVNFDPNEMYSFLDFVQSITGNIDYNLHSKYNESHVINVSEDGYCNLWVNGDDRVLKNDHIDDITAIVLAKSTELNMIKVELSKLLDESEKFITYLQSGKLRANTRKVTATLSRIIHFKYMGVESVKVLERPAEVERDMLSRNVYDELSEYYELEDRYDVIKKQMNNLQSITEAYFKLGKNQSERKLIGFEVFLLILFPAFHILQRVFRF